MSEAADDTGRIGPLLDELNMWERQYGTAHSDDPLLKSTGESNARIAELKARLSELRACFHWNGEEYVLDPPAEPD